MPRPETPSMTAGPFFAYGLQPASYGRPEPIHSRLATVRSKGERIRIAGRVLDSRGKPIDDALVEVWQADGRGRYPSGPMRAAFRGHGRAATNPDGLYCFHTVKPGPVADGEAPHVCAALFARGMLNHMFTRIYFADEEAANVADPGLRAARARARTLLAGRETDSEGTVYRLDFRFGGKDETVFFDI